MQFYEKLDFLMNLTNTTNSELALQIKLDASHISRLRRGQRGALKDETCINSMSAYFTKKCKADYQQRALAEALGKSSVIFNNEGLSKYIAKWLIDEKKDKATSVGNFLTGFSNLNARKEIHEKILKENESIEYPQADISVYYGVDGKRQAVSYFISEVIAQDKPQTLLLYSDEATDWMTEDVEFSAKWASLMTQLLAKGNRIKIIHTISRDLDEMLNAIRQWMPLYMTGLIEPFYYPRKRDGLFKRTLFISPGISAVISNSIGNSIDQAANLLLRRSDIIQAYTGEFVQFLSLCKPLMRIYTAEDKEAYYQTLVEFEKEKSNSLIKTESLSLITMPGNLETRIIARTSKPDVKLKEIREKRKKLFENNLKSKSYTEVIKLHDIEQVKSGEIKAGLLSMLHGDKVTYTLKEYILHLEHLQYLLEKYDNFHIHLIEEKTEINYMMYAREDIGAIVIKTSAPPVILSINEDNLATAFWEFLRSTIGEKVYQYPNDIESSRKLADYIQKLKQSIEYGGNTAG